MFFKVMPVILFFFCIASCIFVLAAVKRLRHNTIRIELERRVIELVNGNTEHPEKPLNSYFIRKGRNLLQRFVAESFTFDFKSYEYIFDEYMDHDKVAIAATEGDKVYLVFLPCGWMRTFANEDWVNTRQHLGGCYTESERGKWLEKVMPLADELTNNALKEL